MKNNQKIDKIISIKFFSLMIFNANLSRSISIRNLDKKSGTQTYMKHVDRFTRVIIRISSSLDHLH